VEGNYHDRHGRTILIMQPGLQVTNVDDDVDDSPENHLALNVDHVFEADECDAFDSDVDEGPTWFVLKYILI
ncbi:hypothetical protein Tco_0305887, partial [Tanacetum coccineum]